MDILIKIPEWKYKSICEGVEASKKFGVVGIDSDIHEAIYNGISLPKGHGRLIIELLTDEEQRIFLKAINREREVCQKIDDEYLDDESNVSLVKICNSIERKVKQIWE